MTRTSRTRLVAALAGGLLLPLAACSQAQDAASGAASSASSAVASATDQSAASSSAGTSSAGTGVDCTLSGCTATIQGADTEVEVLGTTIRLGTIENGRATIGVAGQELSCSQGETVAAGPLSVECTTVTTDSVTLSASLG